MIIMRRYEQEKTFETDFKLKAVAINTTNGGCSPQKITVSLSLTIHLDLEDEIHGMITREAGHGGCSPSDPGDECTERKRHP